MYEPAAIAKILDQKHLTTARNRPFARSPVYAILHNERYIGTFLGKDVRKPDSIPAIIDKEIFYRVQDKIGYIKKNCIRASNQYLLAGKVFCAKCGKKWPGDRVHLKTRPCTITTHALLKDVRCQIFELTY